MIAPEHSPESKMGEPVGQTEQGQGEGKRPATTGRVGGGPWARVAAISSVLLAVLTFCYIVVEIFQWRAMERSLSVSERAWVGVTEFRAPDPVIESGTPTTFKAIANNSGKSPALETVMHFCTRAFKVNEVFHPACNDQPGVRSRTVVWPGMPATLLSAPLSFDTETIADLRSGKRPMYIWGEIRYRDIFDQWHETTFCMRLRTDLRTADMCETYNTAN